MGIPIRPGRDLDVLVAKHILKLPLVKSAFHVDLWFADGVIVKAYSRELQFAGDVLEKLANQGCQIRLSNKAQGNRHWWAYILDPMKNGADSIAQGHTLAHAICLAALIGEGIDVYNKVTKVSKSGKKTKSHGSDPVSKIPKS